MKTKFTMILTLFMALIVQISFAQQKTVSGTVSDENGLPLIGTTVLVVGTSSGTTTDFDGKYSIKAKAGDVLSYSYVGYATQNKTVGAASTINLSLQSDNTLDEVVVTALGLEKKKDEDLSSSTTVNKDALERSKESGIIQGLAGKTSGLKITRNSGDPGAGAYIQIRGQNSLNGNSNPLIIIDGVPVSNKSAGGATDGTVGGATDGVTQQSRLNDLSSEDVESVTILKGVAAASVWGAGAANGVIVIKTKRGKRNSKAVVNIKSSVAFDNINVEFKKQNTFGQGYPSWWLDDGKDYSSDGGMWVANTGLSWGDRISDRTGGDDTVTTGNTRFESATGNIIYPITSKNSTEVFNSTNRDQVFGTGITIDNSVNVAFGADKSSTFISYSDWRQDGIIQGKSSYRRQTFRINQVTDLSEKIKSKVSASYSRIGSDRIQQGSNLQGLYLGYLRSAPDFDNRDYVGTYFNSDGFPTLKSHRSYRNYLGSASPTYNNPGWTINEQDNPNYVDRFTITPQFDWKIKENLTLTTRYGLDYYNDHREYYFPVNSAAGLGTGFYGERDLKEKTENFNTFLNSSHIINENLNLNLILGMSIDRNQYSILGGTSEQFTNPAVGDLRIFGNATAANESIASYKEETRKSGGYFILNMDAYDQLYFEASARYERSSTFEENVFYPSASIGWKFSDLVNNDILSFGKVRVAYGEIGITPEPYSTTTTYGPGGVFSSWGDGLSAAAYGNPFSRSNTLGNPDLKEERIKELEFGADIRLFNNKASLGFTIYDKTTSDAILNVDVAPSSGFLGKRANAAEITNKGLELDGSVNLINNTNFTWKLNANYSHNKNKVTDLNGVESVFLAGFTGTSSRVVEGHPVGTLWGGKFARDSNGGYVLDDNGFPTISEEEGVLGDPNPDWIGGVGTVLSYKGFTLSAQLETSQGNDHWAGTEGVLKYFGIHPETANESTATADLKTFDGRTISNGTTFRGNIQDFGGGDVALDLEWYTANGGGFGNQSESFVKDASWTRLREVSLAYDLPKKLIKNAGFSSIRLTLSGRNLALWSKIDGFDPDINLTGATLGRGLDYFTNPSSQTYAFTLNLTF